MTRLAVGCLCLSLCPSAVGAFKVGTPTLPRRTLLSAAASSSAAFFIPCGILPAYAADGMVEGQQDAVAPRETTQAQEDAAAPRETTQAQQNLQALNAGTRRLSSEGIAEGDLVNELLRRTEANKARNAAIVKQSTEANAFTAIDGSVNRRLVRSLDGTNVYLDAKQIRELTVQRRLACAPSLMEPCREIRPSAGLDIAPLNLPKNEGLKCDANGRNCKF